MRTSERQQLYQKVQATNNPRAGAVSKFCGDLGTPCSNLAGVIVLRSWRGISVLGNINPAN